MASLVSLGMWKDWVSSCLQYIKGTKVLELGHGPGHLQVAMLELGLDPTGLDESRQMGGQASRRIHYSIQKREVKKTGLNGYAQFHNLVRAHAQTIPFYENSFQTIVATFPTEYIYSPATLHEIHRILIPNGRLIIVFSAWFSKTNFLQRLSAWLFQVTGQNSGWEDQLTTQFQSANFKLSFQKVQVKSSSVLIIIADKREFHVPHTR